MTEDQIKKISEYGVSLVSCTIFSMDQEIHDKFSQKEGSLERVLINLNLLKKYNVPIEVKYIITKKTQMNICRFKRFVMKIRFTLWEPRQFSQGGVIILIICN